MKVKIIDKDMGWKRIKKQMEQIKGSFTKVGVLSDAGAYKTGENANLADVATWMEFGTTKGIPSRPFMAQTFHERRNQVNRFIERSINLIYSGKSSVFETLNKLGVWYTGQIKRQIANGDFAPNAPATIKAKGDSTRPLIDTGQLRGSINHKVEVK